MSFKDWFRDRTIRKVAKYGLPAALGKFVNAISGLVTLAILTRYLGPGPFGVIAMIRTVVTVVDSYANFNTWQAIIKYGTEAIANQRPDDVKRIIKLSFIIDVSTAVLGALVVVGAAMIVPGQFGWSSHEAALCAAYGITLVTKVSGTSDGIFRLCDAYRVQAITAGVSAITMTLLVVLAVALDASFESCVFALILGEVLSNIATTISALWVASKSGYGGWRRSDLRQVRTTFPGVVRFFVSTNAQLTVRTTQNEMDMIVVGSMLGRESAGLFRVAKQVGTIPGRIYFPFELVLFTELARCAARRDYKAFRGLLVRAVSIAATGALVIWLVASIAARPMIEVVAGAEFVSVADAFRFYLLAMGIQLCSMTIQRSMIALGRPGTLFLFDFASLLVVIVAAVIGAQQWGLVGVAVAIVLHKAVQLVWSSAVVWRLLRQFEAETAAAAAPAP